MKRRTKLASGILTGAMISAALIMMIARTAFALDEKTWGWMAGTWRVEVTTDKGVKKSIDLKFKPADHMLYSTEKEADSGGLGPALEFNVFGPEERGVRTRGVALSRGSSIRLMYETQNLGGLPGVHEEKVIMKGRIRTHTEMGGECKIVEKDKNGQEKEVGSGKWTATKQSP